MQVSVSGYAKMIGKSRWTVYRMIKLNQLPEGISYKEIAGHKIINLPSGRSGKQALK